MQEKNFKKWHSIKELIHKKEKQIYFQEREIWWCSLGLNVGFEEDGKNYQFERPIIILKRFSNNLFWALPTTSQNKIGKYYYQFERNSKKYSVILSQLRVMSNKRLLRKLGMLPEKYFNEIRSKIKNFL